VDLLVARDHLEAAEAVLAAAGYQREPAWGRRPHRFHRRALPGGVSVKLDVVTEVAFGRHHEVSTDLAPLVLSRRVVVDGIAFPDPSDRQWLVLLHAVLDKGAIGTRHKEALVPWAGREDGVGGTVPLPLRRIVSRLAASGAWDELTRMASALWASLDHDGAQERARVAWRRAMGHSVRAQRALVRPGTTVAVLGPDGAGKSTVVRTLARELPDARLAYLGAYPRDGRTARRPAGLDTIERCLRLALRGAVVEGHRRRGRTVLLDRHPREVPFGPPTRSWRARLRRRLVARMVPAPDVLVVLDAPAAVLHARKPEHRLDEVERMRERYRRLAETQGAVVVDVDRPLADVVADVRDAVAMGPRARPRR
jgi:thymidylate kinase